MSQKMKFAVAGALAGAANGLFGAGGGIFLVPLFTRWAKLEDKRAYATSVAVILPLSIVSA
ncbi:MAG: TSUP family transporter, partial [Oscillospiraceae bacterium]|nr:TSUP family transporter [Oscillospiraceae bacterium]